MVHVQREVAINSCDLSGLFGTSIRAHEGKSYSLVLARDFGCLRSRPVVPHNEIALGSRRVGGSLPPRRIDLGGDCDLARLSFVGSAVSRD